MKRDEGDEGEGSKGVQFPSAGMGGREVGVEGGKGSDNWGPFPFYNEINGAAWNRPFPFQQGK